MPYFHNQVRVLCNTHIDDSCIQPTCTRWFVGCIGGATTFACKSKECRQAGLVHLLHIAPTYLAELVHGQKVLKKSIKWTKGCLEKTRGCVYWGGRCVYWRIYSTHFVWSKDQCIFSIVQRNVSRLACRVLLPFRILTRRVYSILSAPIEVVRRYHNLTRLIYTAPGLLHCCSGFSPSAGSSVPSILQVSVCML